MLHTSYHVLHASHASCLAGVQTVLGVILGGGAGSRLYPLTKKRAKPAVPLGANYRLIDIPVSNCINSNVNKIYVLTQFNSASLNRHLSQAYVSRSLAACPVWHIQRTLHGCIRLVYHPLGGSA